MSRKRETPVKALSIRMDPALHDRIRKAAEERQMSTNFLVRIALTDFVDRLLRVDEIVWTRPTLPEGDDQ